MTSQRNSSIELLRILSMLMVLNVHTFSAPNNLDILTVGGGDLARLFVDFFREASSISCVNLFVLISGYFSINWKVRSISSLVFQVYFWIFLIYSICLISGYVDFSYRQLASRIIGIMSGYWFIPAYIGLYVFAPLLNAFVEKSTRKELLWYIVIFYIFFTIDAMPFSSNYSRSGYSIYSFMGLYLIGRYLKTCNWDCHNKYLSKKKILLWFSIVTFLIAAVAILIASIFKKGGAALHTFPLSTFAYNNPLVIMQSVLIFIFFLKIRLRNKFVNWCSASALALYLLHMHPDLKYNFYDFADKLYMLPILNQYLTIILLIITVALIAIPIDKVRAWMFDITYDKLLEKYHSFFPNKHSSNK